MIQIMESFNKLPVELILQILKNLNGEDLLKTCMLIDKRFNQLCHDNTLWRYMCEFEWEMQKKPNQHYEKYYQKFRQYYAKITISYDMSEKFEIIKRQSSISEIFQFIDDDIWLNQNCVLDYVIWLRAKNCTTVILRRSKQQNIKLRDGVIFCVNFKRYPCINYSRSLRI